MFRKEFKEYNSIHCEMAPLYHEAALEAGLSDSVLNILYTLVIYGNECTQSNISRLTGISRKTIHSAIRKLEAEGHILLETTGKSRPITLTDRGWALVQEKVLPLMQAENAVLESWSPEDRNALLRLSRKYMEDFQANLKKENEK